VPAPVVTEVVHLPATSLGVETEVRFLGGVAAGAFTVEPVAPSEWIRVAELVARYRDVPLATVDASVVAAAERRGLPGVATVDRPAHGPPSQPPVRRPGPPHRSRTGSLHKPCGRATRLSDSWGGTLRQGTAAKARTGKVAIPRIAGGTAVSVAPS
jgi:hypothetical protein